MPELWVADDHAEPLAFVVHDLPREDPRRWRCWPKETVAVVTPNEADGMCGVLRRAGGHEGVDFVALSRPAVAASVGGDAAEVSSGAGQGGGLWHA